ncbi:MAG: hypothetical protein N2447_08145, partial [Thermoanaerobaculum sp.]|nr:hypothetical protein [Thermoanaerobaculum sp.]
AGPATRLHLPAEFLPNQFRGPYVAGVLGAGEGDSGFFVAVDRQGIIYGAYFDRCWEDRWVFLDFTGHPQLALDGSSVVETRLDPQRDVKVLKGAACPP